jgi:hypothetical protein
MTETTSFAAREKILSTISAMSNAKWAMVATNEAQALTLQESRASDAMRCFNSGRGPRGTNTNG